MKTCSRCGIRFSDDRLICPNCGHAPMNGGNGTTYNYGPGNGPARPYQYSVQTRRTRTLDFYERTWFIVLCAIFCWPIAIAMIGLRIYRNNVFKTAGAAYKGNRVKTRGIGKLITGSILAFFGLCFLATVPSLQSDLIATGAVMGGVLTAAGGALIGIFIGQNRDLHKYEALIDNRGNTRISFIASHLQLREDKVRNKLQKLINKGLLSEPENGINAYINGEYNLVVMTRNGNPIVPIETTMAREMAEKKAQEQAERARAEAEAERARRAAPMDIEDRFQMVIEDALPFINDVDVIGYLKIMEKKVLSIRKLVLDDPENGSRPSVQNMKASYIPSTIELISKYVKGTTTADMRNQIKGMFATLSTAFVNIEKQIVEKDEIDTSIDIEVMKQTLARDGLLNSDFDIKL